MSKKQQEEREVIVGLDIGTTKIAAVVGQFHDDGTLNVLGYGLAPSQGLNRGTVVNVDATVNAIRKAIQNAEMMAGCQINNAYAGFADRHISSLNSQGMVPIRDREVTALDVRRVIEAAKTVALPADQQILHILPQEFKVDYEEKIREPIGMSGVRLEAKVHMITGTISAAQNVARCVKRCGLDVNDIVLDQLASSYALLSQDEKELGVCLVDLGGGTTDVMMFNEGVVQHTAALPVAGDQVTKDLAIAFRISTVKAEEIKVQFGCALQGLADPSLTVEVVGLSGRSQRITQVELARVIEPRYEEIFELIKREQEEKGLADTLNAGVVLTGGAANMPGVVDLAERVLGCPVRIGLPLGATGVNDVITNPMYATSVGLLMYAEQQRQGQKAHRFFAGEGVKGLFGKIKSWVQGNF